jgi:hypothetical protein
MDVAGEPVQLRHNNMTAEDRNERQQMWLKTRISQAAPQVLLVPLSK